MRNSELAIITIPERPNGVYSVIKSTRFAKGTRFLLKDEAFERADTQPFFRVDDDEEDVIELTRGRTPMMTFTVPAVATKEVPKVPTCNRHTNCDEADSDTVLGHGRPADHCHDEACEDCVGH